MDYELVEIKDGEIFVPKEITKQIADFKKATLKIKLKEDALKEELKKAMEEYGVFKFEDKNIKVSYTKPSTRVTIDSKKLKTDLPDIYSEYSKTSDVAGSVKIEVKE